MKIITMLSAMLSPIVAITGIIIGIRQHIINTKRLKFELFEKRLEIYNQIATLFAKILQDGTIDKDSINKFFRNTRTAYFLFDKRIDDYIEEIYKKAFDLHYLAKKTDEKGLDKYKEVFSWFENEILKLKEKFAKYLQL